MRASATRRKILKSKKIEKSYGKSSIYGGVSNLGVWRCKGVKTGKIEILFREAR